MNSRVDTHSLNPSNHLGNLALVDRSQTGPLAVDNLARRSSEFLDERKVLYERRIELVK